MFDRRKAEVIGYVVAAVVIVLVAVRLVDRGGQAERAPVAVSGGAAAAPPARAAAARRMLVVDVAGEVRRPGVYRVPAGSRADAALQRAGGVTRRGESAAVNLAMPLRDGQQIVVPRRGAAAAGAGVPETAAGGGAAAGGAGVPAQPISLAAATVAQLDTLDGIGPTLATRIVQYRDAHGGFRSVDELRQVEGIGEKRFESLRQAVQP